MASMTLKTAGRTSLLLASLIAVGCGTDPTPPDRPTATPTAPGTPPAPAPAPGGAGRTRRARRPSRRA